MYIFWIFTPFHLYILFNFWNMVSMWCGSKLKQPCTSYLLFSPFSISAPHNKYLMNCESAQFCVAQFQFDHNVRRRFGFARWLRKTKITRSIAQYVSYRSAHAVHTGGQDAFIYRWHMMNSAARREVTPSQPQKWEKTVGIHHIPARYSSKDL